MESANKIDMIFDGEILEHHPSRLLKTPVKAYYSIGSIDSIKTTDKYHEMQFI